MSCAVDQFCAASGSVIGREHVRCHRNNQDAVAVGQGDSLLVAAVADGCSSGISSEVGARLAVQWIVRHAPRLLQDLGEVEPAALVEAVMDGLLAYLEQVGRGICPDPEAWPATVRDFLLFSLLGAIVGPEWTLVFGLGDGVVSINGQTTVLEAGAANAPPYLGYRLVGAVADVPAALDLQPVIHYVGPTGGLESLVIATDGALELLSQAGAPLKDGSCAGGLAALEHDDRYLRNPSLLHKRLVVIGDVNQRLRDDTSLVLIRRKERWS
jgi:hypothetical protein